MHSIPRVIVVERMEISHRVAIIVICVDSQRLKKCIHTIEKKNRYIRLPIEFILRKAEYIRTILAETRWFVT